jgi:hypothetical protein
MSCMMNLSPSHDNHDMNMHQPMLNYTDLYGSTMSNLLYPLIRLRSPIPWTNGWPVEKLLCFGPEDIPMVFQAVTWTRTDTSYRCGQLIWELEPGNLIPQKQAYRW